MKDLKNGLAFVGTFWSFVHLFQTKVAETSVCIGPSMLPTLQADGDIVLVNRSVKYENYKVGDVVIATSPNDPNMTVCKRILAMSGDSTSRGEIPKGHVWIQGDNVFNSRDSRHYGPIPIALLKGRVVARIWPLTSFGPIKSERPPYGFGFGY